MEHISRHPRIGKYRTCRMRRNMAKSGAEISMQDTLIQYWAKKRSVNGLLGVKYRLIQQVNKDSKHNSLVAHKFPLNQGQQKYYHNQEIHQNYVSASRGYLAFRLNLRMQHTWAWQIHWTRWNWRWFIVSTRTRRRHPGATCECELKRQKNIQSGENELKRKNHKRNLTRKAFVAAAYSSPNCHMRFKHLAF